MIDDLPHPSDTADTPQHVLRFGAVLRRPMHVHHTGDRVQVDVGQRIVPPPERLTPDLVDERPFQIGPIVVGEVRPLQRFVAQAFSWPSS